MNPRSDTDAKKAFLAVLLQRGYTAKITRTPADITARRDDVVHYFEVKYTKQPTTYFGAATLTEWEAALANEDRFWFVVALQRDNVWQFREYTPTEFLSFSYVPPFKIFFNLPLQDHVPVVRSAPTRRLQLTREAIEQMVEFYKQLRPGTS